MGCHSTPYHLRDATIRICLLAASLAMCISCVDQVTLNDSEAQDKIIGGQAERGEPATVKVLSSNAICTGTLIAPRVVITAAHCVSKSSADNSQILPKQLEEVQVYEGGRLIERSAVSGFVFHERWNYVLEAGYDIALIYLRSPLNVNPIALDQVPPEQRVGQVGKAVGFGVTERGDGGEKRSTEQRVGHYSYRQMILRSPNAQLQSTCEGDSGGPFFIMDGGRQVLSSITSYGPTDCATDYSYNVAVYPFLGWINENLNGPTTGITQKATSYGDAPCADLMGCLTACPEDNEFCPYVCMEESTQYAQETFILQARCAQQNNCQDYECAERMCPNEYQMCMSDTGGAQPNPNPNPNPDPNPNPNPNPNPDPNPNPNPDPNPNPNPNPSSGSDTCEDVFWCANDCDEDPSCIQACVERGTISAQQTVEPLLSCLLSSTCADIECFQRECAYEFNACSPNIIGDSSRDGQDWYSCGQIFTCIGDCGGDSTCQAECISRGDDLAQLKFLNVDLCAQNWSCQDRQCLESYCAGYLYECLDD